MSLTVPAEVLTSVDLPPDVAVEAAGGATGQLWKVTGPDGQFALRAGSPGTISGHLAAMAAAGRAGLPVPEVIRYATAGPGTATVLLSWLPGMTVFDVVRAEPARAHRIGVLMGETQRALHEVAAPPELRDILTAGPTGWLDERTRALPVPRGSALLHLDFHGLNLLVEGDRISGILDWDNAHAGHPLLDVARAHTLLTVEPAFSTLQPGERAILADLRAGWVEGYGPLAASIPPVCLAWAGRVMLGDLARRYASEPSALDDLRRWTESWERRSPESH
ncbi:MAG TPA: aminoglycoside phosphotransferase family protein [Actinopolymorphaceae bacterium]|nr:aminoglycoside phosphotransferase family protein [Actinopolymorphaceae bacterium]